jgi:cytidine deaminase
MSNVKKEWTETYNKLLDKAISMRNYSYVPYSKFSVGAALLSKDGRVFGGCNIENSAYSVGICAERTAFSKAISKGVEEFSAILIVGNKKDKKNVDITPPCGMCRQFIREFTDSEFLIILAKTDDNDNLIDYEIHKRDELLPYSFGPENLQN